MKHLIGPRLAHLRKQLSESDQQGKWSMEKVAKATGLTKNQVLRMENDGSGAIDAFLLLMRFYHQKGFNTQWVLQEDNSNIPLYLDQQSEQSNARTFVSGIIQQLQGFLGGELGTTKSE